MKENDIRPQELFDELLRLNKLDVETYFSDASTKNINCPACGSKGKYSFSKNNFSFEECEICKTLYVSPRPDKKYFDAYYKDSLSAKYWATTFYKQTEKSRREMLWKPKRLHRGRQRRRSRRRCWMQRAAVSTQCSRPASSG